MQRTGKNVTMRGLTPETFEKEIENFYVPAFDKYEREHNQTDNFGTPCESVLYTWDGIYDDIQ